MFYSNLVVTNPYDGQNCFDVGSFKPGHGDGFFNNSCIIMGCRNPTCVDKVTSVSQCDPSIVTLKDNRYFTTHGNATMQKGDVKQRQLKHGKVMLSEIAHAKMEQRGQSFHPC